MGKRPQVSELKAIDFMLWQPLDQCSIAALTINLKGGYLVENTSCVIHKRTRLSSLQTVDLVFSIFYFSFLFSFCFIFYFLFLEQLGLIGHAVTSVTT